MKNAALTLILLRTAFAEPNLPVPPNLTVEGIPPIPVELLESLSRYNEGRTAQLMDWHPARREILITTRFADVPQVHRVATPGGDRTQLTFFADRVSNARWRPPRGEQFIFSKDAGGGEYFQLFLFDPERGEAKRVTDGASRNTDAEWSHNGRRLVFSSTRRNGRDTDLWVMDPSDLKTAKILVEVKGGGWSVEDWSPDDRWLLVVNRRSVNDSSLHLVDAQTGAMKPLTPPSNNVSYTAVRFSHDGKGIYLATDRDSEFRRVAYMDLASGKLDFLLPSQRWDAGGLALSSDGKRLAFTLNEDGSDTLHVLDTATRRELRLPKIPLGTITGVRWHSNGSDLAFGLASAKSPSDVYSINVDKATFERWTTSETGGVNPATFSEPELIRWKSFDGLAISGFLYMPPKSFTGRRPVIINIHGGPEGQSRAGFLSRGNYYLNELGVAVIYPNVRGSLGYGKTFVTLDNGRKREDSVKDIGALLDWIATRRDLDPARVMVTGGSYGGYMTLASMTHFNDRLRCAVDVVGVSNFVTLLRTTGTYRTDLRRVEYGDEQDPDMREFLLRISPLTNASKITKPMMIVAGKNDPRVPASEGDQMTAAIRRNGGTVWKLVADDEGHGFAKKRNQDFQFAATVMFVKEYLLK